MAIAALDWAEGKEPLGTTHRASPTSVVPAQDRARGQDELRSRRAERRSSHARRIRQPRFMSYQLSCEASFLQTRIWLNVQPDCGVCASVARITMGHAVMLRRLQPRRGRLMPSSCRLVRATGIELTASTAAVFDAFADTVAPATRRIPDPETGPHSCWVSSQARVRCDDPRLKSADRDWAPASPYIDGAGLPVGSWPRSRWRREEGSRRSMAAANRHWSGCGISAVCGMAGPNPATASAPLKVPRCCAGDGAT